MIRCLSVLENATDVLGYDKKNNHDQNDHAYHGSILSVASECEAIRSSLSLWQAIRSRPHAPFLLTAIFWAAITWPAAAAPFCAPHEVIANLLAEKHKEMASSIGVFRQPNGAGGLVEIFTTADGSTWTMVATGPRGSCVVLHGENWRASAPKHSESRS